MDDAPTKKDILHSVVGGFICFLITIVLFSFMDIILKQILISLGVSGVVAFTTFAIAKAAIVFALVYLVCGFIGGLYTGYFVEKGLRITLLITGGVGFVSFLVLLYFFGRVTLNIGYYYLEMIILPLLGNIIGAYLGGYTISWQSEGEEVEEEGIRLDLET